MTRGSVDAAAASAAVAARASRRTLLGTKIERLFAEYRVNLKDILRPEVHKEARRPDTKMADRSSSNVRRARRPDTQ
jgi:hypothetical protein